MKDALETHLRNEPAKVSRSRIKRLRGISKPQYRLRVGDVRIFYDVTETAVEVLAIVERRLRKSPFAGMRQPFPHWLRHLREVTLGTLARQALCDDLAVALRSYADAGPIFTCV